MSDLLANVERVPTERPARRPDEGKAPPGYWLGSATSQIEQYRTRALLAEAMVARLSKALERWEPST